MTRLLLLTLAFLATPALAQNCSRAISQAQSSYQTGDFDATISRTAAWVIGTRNMQKALLQAMLLPLEQLKQAETRLDYTSRFVLTEEFKDLPTGAVWAEFCERLSVPSGHNLVDELDAYQAKVATRG